MENIDLPQIQSLPDAAFLAVSQPIDPLFRVAYMLNTHPVWYMPVESTMPICYDSIRRNVDEQNKKILSFGWCYWKGSSELRHWVSMRQPMLDESGQAVRKEAMSRCIET